jgi:hypothetical protein
MERLEGQHPAVTAGVGVHLQIHPRQQLYGAVRGIFPLQGQRWLVLRQSAKRPFLSSKPGREHGTRRCNPRSAAYFPVPLCEFGGYLVQASSFTSLFGKVGGPVTARPGDAAIQAIP